jgi:adenine-specific DNA-methyltransferase
VGTSLDHIDTSRVPLALARQRLLTATFSYYELRDENAGVSGGLKYERRQNRKGEEVGGIIPYISKGSIANEELPEEEVLVDRPNESKGIVRVSGPFVVEATIPTPADFEADGNEDSRASSPEEFQNHIERMLEALRKSPVLRLPNNQSVTFKNVRQPAKSLSLNAEAEIVTKTVEDLGEEADRQKSLEMKSGPLAAFVFGPENGAVSEQMVFQAAREAYAKSYQHLYVIGFAIEDAATKLVQNCEAVVGIPATYVAATMDLQMGDLLKTTRASQIFSVTGAPEIRLRKIDKKSSEGDQLYQVRLLGMDIFDAVTMENTHRGGDDVTAWFLDTDYNELAFFVAQAFFPRTAAWDNLKRELRGVYADSVWEHLAGTTSEPFVAGERKQIAVKVIDDRGNELLVVKKLSEAESE